MRIPGPNLHKVQIQVGRVQGIVWGINPGRNVQGGLVVNQSATRWFEPARRIPARIELAGGMDAWPKKVRVGGKVSSTVYTSGKRNPVAWIARTVQRLLAWFSYLYYSEDYADPNADVWVYAEAGSPLPKPEGYDGPRSYFEFLETVRPETDGEHGMVRRSI